MKNHSLQYLLFILLLTFVTLFTSACIISSPAQSGNNGEDEEEGESNNLSEPEDEELKENQIYSKSSELYLIPTAELFGNDILFKITSSFDSVRESAVILTDSSSEKHEHEIVIGNDTGRKITDTALMYLNRVESKSEDEVSFLVYSDGASVALVYDMDDDRTNRNRAVEYFLDNFVSEELILAPGQVCLVTYDLIEYYGEMDIEYANSLWAEVEARVGKNTTDALKKLYSIYSKDVVYWLAGLFEPSICVCNGVYGETECKNTKYCGTAGFYYSNSGRTAIGYLPDVESTYQALSFMGNSGMFKLGGSHASTLGAKNVEKILNFVLSLQEENGFFYHPQWGIEKTDQKIGRRGRDLTWATNILRSFGRTPYYDTPNGIKGSGAPSAAATLSNRLGMGSVAAVNAVVASESYAENLQDKESFKKYLIGFETGDRQIAFSSYSIGNEFSTQYTQIVARDKEIGTKDDPTPLMSTLIEWLNKHQDPQTGHWDKTDKNSSSYSPYQGVNGLFKISGAYTTAGVLMPNVDKAIYSAIEAISDPAPLGGITSLYNTWYTVSLLFANITKCGTSADMALIPRIREELKDIAPSAIIASRDKVVKFMKEDGSFSYYENYTSGESQGMPVAVGNVNEGDMNATGMGTNGIMSNIFSCLGLGEYLIPFLGQSERAVLKREIAKVNPIIKYDAPMVYEPIDFEYDMAGDRSSYLDYSKITSGDALVVEREDGGGNAVSFTSAPGSGDYISIPCNENSAAKVDVFEGDLCLLRTNTDYYSLQISLGGAYMFSIKAKPDNLEIWEMSSGTEANSVNVLLSEAPKLGEWFSVRVEYYKGNKDTVRIKFYLDPDLSDGKELSLIAVTDNYYDYGGGKIDKGTGTPRTTYNGTSIYALSSVDLELLMDNVCSYQRTDTYEPELDPDNQPPINIDPPDSDAVVYDFEDGIPESVIKNGEGSLTDVTGSNALLVTESSLTLGIPVNVRTRGTNCTSLSLDISATDLTSGTVMTLTGNCSYGVCVGFKLVVSEENGEKYLVFKEYSGIDGATIDRARIPESEETVNLRIDYYSDARATLLYVDGVFVGISTAISSNAKRYRIENFNITVDGGKGNIIVDNIVSERIVKNYSESTKPKNDRVVEDFESAAVLGEISGNATVVGSRQGGAALELDSRDGAAGYSLTVNNRSDVFNAIIFKIQLDFVEKLSTGETHRIVFNDDSGKAFYALSLKLTGDRLEVYEVSSDGVALVPVCSYYLGNSIDLYVKIFPSKKMVYFFNTDEECIGKSSVFYTDVGANVVPDTVSIASAKAKCVLNIDNVVFETATELYSKYTVAHPDSTDLNIGEGIDFEHNTSSGIPSDIPVELKSPGSDVRIERKYNGVSGKQSNVLAFDTDSGGNDRLTFRTSDENIGSYSAVVFECDIMLESRMVSGQIFQLMLGPKGDPSAQRAYMMTLSRNSSGDYYMQDYSVNTGSNDKIVTTLTSGGYKADEWHKFRIEYFKGDSTDILFRIYFDGVLVKESNNYYGVAPSMSVKPEPNTLIEQLSFYALSDSKATVYVDNVILYGTDELSR